MLRHRSQATGRVIFCLYGEMHGNGGGGAFPIHLWTCISARRGKHHANQQGKGTGWEVMCTGVRASPSQGAPLQPGPEEREEALRGSGGNELGVGGRQSGG